VTQPGWKNTIAISGAGSGFGAALAHKYAADGWKVAVTDIDEDRARQTLFEIEQKGGDGFFMLLDTTKSDHWQQLEDAVMQHWGGLHVLVNNAGVATAGNVEDTSMDDWQWVLDIDLMGVVRGCHQFARLFKRQGSCRFAVYCFLWCRQGRCGGAFRSPAGRNETTWRGCHRSLPGICTHPLTGYFPCHQTRNGSDRNTLDGYLRGNSRRYCSRHPGSG